MRVRVAGDFGLVALREANVTFVAGTVGKSTQDHYDRPHGRDW